MEIKKKHIAILGSTGSIGTQTLEVIDAHPERFVVEVLTANNNSDLLIKQAKKVYNSKDLVEGATSFTNKKDPKWQGK